MLPLAGCRDDDFGSNGNEEEGPRRGTISIDLTPLAGAPRSRSLDMNDGASVTLQNLWIAVYNVKTGQKIGSTTDWNRRVLTTGVVAKNQLTVNFASDYSNPEVCIVGVANFDGVTDSSGTPIIDLLEQADNWNVLMALDVDAASAYAGEKGEAAGASSPFLMGYFLNATGVTRSPKFDQFQKRDSVCMYPAAAHNAMKARLLGSLDTDNDIYVPAGALVLRRLVSGVNVNIEPGPGVEVSNVSYRVFNMPTTVFLAQRCTDTTSPTDYEKWTQRSPNAADRFVRSDGSMATEVYYDGEWTTTDNLSFSFQHFENKHWGTQGLQSFSEREEKTANGLFAALCPGGEAPYNNYGSYFKIRMTVKDAGGRISEVEYTIHEGLCNNENGQTTESDERYRDFSSFRNNNYTYTINVNGINQIAVNATSDEDGLSHQFGQEGSIWTVEYATDSKVIPKDGGTFGNMKFDANSKVAMRFCWNDGKSNNYDITYIPGVNQSMSLRILNDNTLANVWPSTSATMLLSNPSQIPDAVNSVFTIVSSTGASYNLRQFLSRPSYSPAETFQVRVNSYDTGEQIQGNPRSFMRALYLIDTNKLNIDGYDGCSMSGLIYVAEQYPETEFKAVQLNDEDMIWHNAYRDNAAQAGHKWCGTTYSRVYLSWVHLEEAKGYTVSIDGKSYRINNVDQYLDIWNGKNVIQYPLYTTEFAAKKYDVTITPIVDENIYQAVPYTATQGLDLITPEWWVKSTPGLKDIDTKGKTKFNYEFYGLEYIQDNSTVSASTKGSYISFGGGPNLTNRILRIFITKSGELTSYVRSNLGDGGKNDSKSRYAEIMVVYEDQMDYITINDLRNGLYPEQYWKAASELTRVSDMNRYDTKHIHFDIDRPAYVYFCNDNGNALYFGFKYEPD